jgi:hypothetical protein
MTCYCVYVVLSFSYALNSRPVRCSSRCSISEEHLVGPPMTVRLVFHHIITTVTLDHIVASRLDRVATVTSDTTVAYYSLGCPSEVITRYLT